MALRLVALLCVMAVGVLTMVWPWRWPVGAEARSQLSYATSCVCGIAALLLLPFGHGPTVPFFVTVSLVAWLGLGVLWLIRRNPQIPNPAWTKKPWSIADWGLIGILVLSGLAAIVG